MIRYKTSIILLNWNGWEDAIEFYSRRVTGDKMIIETVPGLLKPIPSHKPIKEVTAPA